MFPNKAMHAKTYDYVSLAKEIVLFHLPKNEFRVFLFGGPAVGNAKPKSDIDIGIWGSKQIPIKLKIKIEEAFEESIIPFKVDLVYFTFVDKTFKKYASLKTIEWA